MKAVEFEQQNVVFAKDQPGYKSLPAKVFENGDVITCWELSDQDFERLVETRNIFLVIKTFNEKLQPVFLTTDKSEINL